MVEPLKLDILIVIKVVKICSFQGNEGSNTVMEKKNRFGIVFRGCALAVPKKRVMIYLYLHINVYANSLAMYVVGRFLFHLFLKRRKVSNM